MTIYNCNPPRPGSCHTTKTSLETIEQLYNRNLFLDAFRLCQKEYADPRDLKKEDPRRILLLGRLAFRLGGRETGKQLFQMAREKEPDHPLVLYFAGKSDISNEHLLVQLEEISSLPEPSFDCNEDKASWLASAAWTYARVRDFQEAHHCLARAEAFEARDAWVSCCKAEVLCLEDRWQDALDAVHSAWDQSPGMPQAAATMGRVLAKLDDLPLLISRLMPVALEKQSFETMLTTIWYICALAERHTTDQCERLARKAMQLARRLDALTPLKDAELQANLALLHMDIAWIINDYNRMRSQADRIDHLFYQRILDNINANAPSNVVITRYKPVYQKHNTCLPTSIAAVLNRFGISVDEDALAEKLTFQGTAIWRVVDWLKQQGLAVKPFIADGATAVKLLKNHLPFVLIIKSIHFYHAMAAVGLDETAGVVLIHDPSQIRLEKILLSEIGKYEAPFGLEALAMTPAHASELLDLIPDEVSEPYAAFIAFQKSQATTGSKQAFTHIEKLKERYTGDHPFVVRMEAIHHGMMGQPAMAIQRQEALLGQFPDCEHIRQELLGSLYRTGNKSYLRKVLSGIVLKKRIPGIRATQKWLYPPAEYVAQYANHAGTVKAGYATSVDLLRDALQKDPTHAACFHVLGDLHNHQGKLRESLLPYRCAATLEPENNHYARAFVDALARSNRLEDGFDFLAHRVEKLGDSLAGGEIRIALIDAYEGYGYPDRAIASLKQALARHPADAYLLTHAVKFWGRLGYKAQEQTSLSELSKTSHRPSFFSAQTSFHRMRGNWKQALEACRKWLDEQPDNMDARGIYAELWAMARGMDAALSLTETWMTQNPGNDDYEALHYDYVKALFKRQRQQELLRGRLKRNPYDLWAYRELAFTLIHTMDVGKNRDADTKRSQVDRIIETCKALSADEAILFIIQAELAAFDGNFKMAAGLCLKAIRQEPEYAYAFRRAWEFAEKLSEPSRKKLFSAMERSMFKSTGFLFLSKDLAQMAAEAFGIQTARDIVAGWTRQLPHDPEITKARIHLLLEYGQGRTDAENAVDLLKSEIKRFPNHADFKFLLSRAYRILQDEKQWVATSNAILAQFPLSNNQRRQLAEYYQLHNRPRKAIRLLVRGVAIDPLDEWVRFDLSALLFRFGKHSQAKTFIRNSLARIPESISLRGRIVDLLFDQGEDDLAVATAKEGLSIYPDGAAVWKTYADALWRCSRTSDMKVVETAYQRALGLNPRLLEAADCLAELYAYQNRFAESRALITSQLPHHVDQGRLHTRLAWIERRAGNSAEAMKQLRNVLNQWPRQAWAWQLMLDWINQDENWTMAKMVFKNVHPVMADNPGFVSEKLYVLHRAGLADASLRQEWDRLLNDYPENEKIHCLRFDILLEQEDYTGADKILSGIEKYAPDSPYLHARRVALSTDQQNFDQAVATALRMMTLPVNVGSWCRQTVWGAFRDYKKLPMLVDALLQVWQTGAAIEPNCFRHMLGLIENIWPPPGPFSRSLMKHGLRPRLIKRLIRLLDQTMGRDTPDGDYTAAVLDKITDYGFSKMVIDFSKKHPEFAASRTKVWQLVGYAMVVGPARKSERAAQWLENWREHPGCEMWVVSNYLIAIERSRKIKRDEKLALFLDHAGAAIEHLPGDHTLQYVVCKYCEAALQLGRDDAFRDKISRFGNIIRDTDSGYWKRGKEIYLPWAMLLFEKLLAADSSSVVPLIKRFKKEKNNQAPARWVLREWKKRAGLIRGQTNIEKDFP